MFHIHRKENLNNPKKAEKGIFITDFAAISCFSQIERELNQVSPITSGSRAQNCVHCLN